LIWFAIPGSRNAGPPSVGLLQQPGADVSRVGEGTLANQRRAIIAKATAAAVKQFSMDMNGTTYRFYVSRYQRPLLRPHHPVSPNGAWQHLAATFDATNGIMDFYVNGQLVNVTVAPFSLNTNSHEVSIGNRQSAAAAYNCPSPAQLMMCACLIAR